MMDTLAVIDYTRAGLSLPEMIMLERVFRSALNSVYQSGDNRDFALSDEIGSVLADIQFDVTTAAGIDYVDQFELRKLLARPLPRPRPLK
jgi:hypothetical protein